MNAFVVVGAVGVVLVAAGLAFAERSWGWTYGLVVIGVVMLVGATLGTRRRRRGRGAR